MARIDSFSDPSLDRWPTAGTVVLFDLEYTSWPGSLERNWSLPDEQREIVQMGAVKAVCGDRTYEPIDTLDLLVQPAVNPDLSDYFTELTGIRKETLMREGVRFSSAWERFRSFCAGASQVWCVGKDGEVLRENFVLNGMSEVISLPCFDIRTALAAALRVGIEEIVSSRLPGMVQLELSGRAHRALDDAMAVLKVINRLAERGALE